MLTSAKGAILAKGTRNLSAGSIDKVIKTKSLRLVSVCFNPYTAHSLQGNNELLG